MTALSATLHVSCENMHRILQRSVLGAMAICMFVLPLAQAEDSTVAKPEDSTNSAQSTDLDSAASSKDPQEMALRYFDLLKKRPAPGYVFDRFYNTWLQTSTLSDLETFLLKNLKDDDSVISRILLALYYEKNADTAKALEMYDQALELSPASAAVLYQKAELETGALRFENAILSLNAALEKSPDEEIEVKIRKLMGKVLARDGKSKEAIECWRKLLDGHQNDYDLQEEILSSQMAEGLLDQAIEDCQALIGKSTDAYRKVRLQLLLGQMRQNMGQKDKALAIWREAIASAGTGSWIEREALDKIRTSFRREDDLKGLAAELAQLAKTYPGRIGILRMRAQTLADLGETDAAVEAGKALLLTAPGDRNLRQEYVDLLDKCGKKTEAIAELTTLCADFPDDMESAFRLARLQHASGNHDEETTTLAKLAAREQADEVLCQRIASHWQNYSHPEQAELAYQAMITKFPDSERAKETYAEFLLSVKKPEPAIAIFQDLAANADTDRLMRYSGILSSGNEMKAALELLQKDPQKSEADPRVLAKLCMLSVEMKQLPQALDYALKRLELTRRATELDAVLSDVVRIAVDTDQAKALEEKLSAQSCSAQQTCLLASLIAQRDEGDLPAAKAPLEAALKNSPDSEAMALLWQTMLRFERMEGNIEACADILEKLLTVQPERESAIYQELASISRNLRQWDKAVGWCDAWQKKLPSLPAPTLLKARLLQENNNEEEALKVLRQLALKIPDNVEIRQRLAQVFESNQKYSDAARIYWQLLEESDSLQARLGFIDPLLRVARMQGRVDDLKRHFQTRAENNPRSVFPLLALSQISEAEYDLDEQATYLRKASELKGDDVPLLHAVARVSESEGDLAEAIRMLNRALPKEPGGNTRQWLIRLYLQSGAQEKATELFEEAMGSIPTTEALEKQVVSLYEMNLVQVALKMLRRYPQLVEQDYRLCLLRGVCEMETKETAAAWDSFRAAIQATQERNSQAVSTVHSHFGRFMFKPKISGLDDLFMQIQSGQMITYYRMQRQMGAGGFSSGAARAGRFGFMGGAGVFPLPARHEDVLTFIAAWAACSSSEKEKEPSGDLIRRLKELGLDRISLRITLATNPQILAKKSLSELLKDDAYRNDPAALGLLIQMQITKNASREDFLQVYQILKGKSTELAFMAACQAQCAFVADAGVTDDQAGKKQETEELLLPELLEAFDQIEKEVTDETALFSTVSSAYSLGARRNAETSKDAFGQFFTGRMLEYYHRMSDETLVKTPWFGHVMSDALFRSGAFEEWGKILNGRVEKSQKNPGQKRNAFMRYFGGYSRFSGSAMQPIHHTHLNLSFTKIAPDIIEMIQMASSQARSLDESERKTVETILAGLQQPWVKVIYLLRQDRREELDDAITKIPLEENADSEELLLRAALHGEQKRNAEAVKLIGQARKKLTNQQQQRQADSAIVYYALEDDALNDENRQIAREALQRMLRYRLSRNELQGLSDAFSRLGMDKDVKELDKRLAEADANSVLGMQPGSMTREINEQTIKELVSSGKKDSAVRLLARDYRARHMRLMSNYQNGFPWELNNLQEMIKRQHLESDVLAEIAVDDQSKDLPKLLAYAALASAFDKKDEAVRCYKQALEIRSDLVPALVELAVLLESSDKSSSDEYVSQAMEIAPSQVIMMCSQRTQSNQQLASVIQYTRVLTCALPFVGKTQVESMMLMQTKHAFLEPYMYSKCLGQSRILGIIEKDDNNGKLSVEAKELVRLRDETVLALCDEMLKIPVLAEDAFGVKALLEQDKGTDPEQIATLARSVLSSADNNPFYTVLRYSNGRDQRSLLSPIAYLYIHALEHDGIPALKQWIGTLDSGNERAKSLRMWVKLYESAEGQLGQAALNELSRLGDSGEMFSAQTLDLLARTLAARKGNDDLSALFSRIVEIQTRTGNYYAIQSLGEWPVALAQAGLVKQAEDSMQQLKNACLKEELISFQGSSIAQNTPDYQTLQGFSQLLNVCAQDEHLILPSLKMFNEIGGFARAPSIREDGSNQFSYRLFEHCKNDHSLLQMPFIKPLDEMSLDGIRNDSFSRIAGDLRSNKERLACLRKTSPMPFGLKLILAMADRKVSGVYACMGEELETLKSLPQEKREKLLLFVSAWEEQSAQRDVIAEGPANEFAAYLKTLQSSVSQDEINELLEPDLSRFTSSSYEEKVVKVVRAMIADESQASVSRTIEFLEKCIPNLKRLTPRNRISSNNPRNSILRQIRSKVKTPAAFSVFWQMADENADFSHDEYRDYIHTLAYFFKDSWTPQKLKELQARAEAVKSEQKQDGKTEGKSENSTDGKAPENASATTETVEQIDPSVEAFTETIRTLQVMHPGHAPVLLRVIMMLEDGAKLRTDEQRKQAVALLEPDADGKFITTEAVLILKNELAKFADKELRDTLADHYVAWAKNNSLPVSLRIGCGNYMIDIPMPRFYEQVRPVQDRFRMACLPLFAKLADRDFYGLNSSEHFLNTLDLVSTPEEMKTVEEIQSLFRRQARQRLGSNVMRRYQMTNSMIIMALMTGDDEALPGLLQNPPSDTNYSILRLLLAHGKTELAESFGSANWMSWSVSAPHMSRIFLLTPDEKQVALEALGEFKNPDLAMLAKIYVCGFASRPPRGAPSAKISGSLNGGKLSELIPEFFAHPFADDSLRRQCLTLLLHADNGQALYEQAKKDFGDTQAEVLQNALDQEDGDRLEQYLLYTKMLARSGHLEDVGTFYRVVVPFLKKRNDQNMRDGEKLTRVGRMLRDQMRFMYEKLADGYPLSSDEEIQQGFRDVAEIPEKYTLTEAQRMAEIAVFAYAIQAKADEGMAWYQSLQKERQSVPQKLNFINQYYLTRFFGQRIRAAKTDDEKQKILDQFNGFINDPARMGLFERLKKNKPEDIMAEMTRVFSKDLPKPEKAAEVSDPTQSPESKSGTPSP